jgi:hypothetical protein
LHVSRVARLERERERESNGAPVIPQKQQRRREHFLTRRSSSRPQKTLFRKKQHINKKQFTNQVIGAAGSEFAALCREMDVEAQLADLEALCMRRGLSAEAQRSGDAGAGTSAAGRAARVAAKREERDALAGALEALKARQERLRAAVGQERAQADALARECEAVGRQVAEVFEAAAA